MSLAPLLMADPSLLPGAGPILLSTLSTFSATYPICFSMSSTRLVSTANCILFILGTLLSGLASSSATFFSWSRMRWSRFSICSPRLRSMALISSAEKR